MPSEPRWHVGLVSSRCDPGASDRSGRRSQRFRSRRRNQRPGDKLAPMSMALIRHVPGAASLRGRDRLDACACWGCACHGSWRGGPWRWASYRPACATCNSCDAWSWISWTRNLRATAGGTDRRPPTGVAKDPIMVSDGRAFKVISRRSLDAIDIDCPRVPGKPTRFSAGNRPIGTVGHPMTGIARLAFYIRS